MFEKNSLIKSNDRIFIAGSSGMAGNAISKSLEKHGFRNQLTPRRHELDLSISNQVTEWFQENKPDVVIIAAAKVGGIHANSTQQTDFLLENLKIQNNIIETAWKSKVRRLLFLGSSCIYPKFSKQPIREEYLLTGSLEPTNESYAIAKIAGIKLCSSLRLEKGFDAISLMPTNLYGPGDNYHYTESHVLPALIRRFHEAKEKGEKIVTCWGTGEALREFLYVGDLGEACVFALKHWNPEPNSKTIDSKNNPFNIINVGSGLDITIKEVAEKVSKIIGFNGKIYWDHSKPDGCPKKQLDVSRMHYLGWEAKTSLNRGIQITYQSFLEALKQDNLRT